MPDTADQDREMSDKEIREVFETLNLPTAPKPFVPMAQQPAPMVFFTVSGHSPPLQMP